MVSYAHVFVVVTQFDMFFFKGKPIILNPKVSVRANRAKHAKVKIKANHEKVKVKAIS